MSSSRQKRKKLKIDRDIKRIKGENLELESGLKAGTVIAVCKEKIISRSALPNIPDYYRDTWFTCKECGYEDLWTAKQQQRWHEEQGGEIEAVAVKCRACRLKDKARREVARKIHLEGLARKKARPEGEQAAPSNP